MKTPHLERNSVGIEILFNSGFSNIFNDNSIDEKNTNTVRQRYYMKFTQTVHPEININATGSDVFPSYV